MHCRDALEHPAWGLTALLDQVGSSEAPQDPTREAGVVVRWAVVRELRVEAASVHYGDPHRLLELPAFRFGCRAVDLGLLLLLLGLLGVGSMLGNTTRKTRGNRCRKLGSFFDLNPTLAAR